LTTFAIAPDLFVPGWYVDVKSKLDDTKEEDTNMTAYMIAQVKVHDTETYDTYRTGVAPTLEPYGGEFIVRGGQIDVVEGEQEFPRMVIIKFPSMEKAHAWHDCPEYMELAKIRHAAAESRVLIVEGFDG
jgi:uncharacterized protein (DUF1330 family)